MTNIGKTPHKDKKAVTKWYTGTLMKVIFLPLLVISIGGIIYGADTGNKETLQAGFLFLGFSAATAVGAYFLDVYKAKNQNK